MKKLLSLLMLLVAIVTGASAYEGASGDVSFVKINSGGRANKMADGCYYYRPSSGYNWSDGNGVKTQSNASSLVFYLGAKTDVTIDVKHNESKNAHTVTATVYSLTEEQYASFYAITSETAVDFTLPTTSTTSFNVDVTAETKTFTGTKQLESGYYAMVVAGEKGNTYFNGVHFEAQESTESPSITSDLNIKYNTMVNGVLPLSIETENAFSYQWYINSTASTEGAEAIEGATEATYNYTASEEGTKYIYCVATNNNATGDKTVRSKIAAIKATAAAAATISWDFGTTAPSENAFPTVAYSAESDKFDSSTSALGENVAYEANYDHCLLNDEGEDEENVYVVRVKPSATTNNEITFTVNVKEGYTFTPASVSFVAMKQGTNGDVTIDAKWFAEDQDDVTLASGVKLKRASSSGTYATPGGDRLSYAVNGSSSTGACGLKLILNTSGKSYGIGEIKIVGFVSEAVTTETITTENGVATYVTENALDFTGLATKAYVVTGVNEAKTSVTTEAVTTVPAGTALLVKGATVNVPVIANATAPATNLFQISDGTVTGGDDIFAYSKSAKQFKKVSSSIKVPAGKCYLQIEGVSGNALDLDFEGEATAVDAIAEADEAEAAPVKVIKNGKLYIGNFNVAGQQVK